MMTNIWEDDFAPPLWDRSYIREKRLSTQPEVVATLIAAFGGDPQTSTRLTDLRREPPPEHTAHLLLSATWAPTGMPVLVKVNASAGELHWMPALGQRAPDLVPQVLAGGERIGPYAVRWLVLEQLPQMLSHAWGDRMYDLLAAAAVRFQQAAQSIERRFVGLVCLHATASSIERGLRAGCPRPVRRVLERLESDWAWVNEQCGL
jgi:hypothetical protein